jgi:undecaprenyl pyrophosphate synthase
MAACAPRSDAAAGGVGGALRRAACAALRAGPVPAHVAFIMDGNRRFADARGWDRAQGHAHGFDKARVPRQGAARRRQREHS